MVQRVVDAVVVRHETQDSAAPGERQAMETTTRKVKRRRPHAMTAIKARMLRCSRAKADQGHQFKRGYLTGRGADSAAVDSTVFFYLACLVCTARPSSVSIGVQKLK